MKRRMFLLSGFLALGGMLVLSGFLLVGSPAAFDAGIMAQSFLVSLATSLSIFWMVWKTPSIVKRSVAPLRHKQAQTPFEVEMAEGFSLSLVSGDDIGVMEIQFPYRTGQEFDVAIQYQHKKQFSNTKPACMT